MKIENIKMDKYRNFRNLRLERYREMYSLSKEDFAKQANLSSIDTITFIESKKFDKVPLDDALKILLFFDGLYDNPLPEILKCRDI